MSLWVTIVLGGVLTFATRLSFILLLERISVPDWFQRSLRFVPVAVLSAIIAPGLFSRNGAIDLSPANAQVLPGLIAIVVAWRTKNILLTISVGMAALVILQALLARA